MLSKTLNQKVRSRTPGRFLGRWGLSLLLGADLVSINVAFLAAYWLRYYGGIGGEVAEPFFVGLNAYLPIILILNIALPLLGAASGIYRPAIQLAFFEELMRVMSSISLGFMGITTVIFILQRFSYSRAVLLMAWAVTVAALCSVRIGRRIALSTLRRRGIGVKRALVVGEAGEHSIGRTVMHIIATEPGILYRLVGFVSANGDTGDQGRFRCLGTLRELPAILEEEQIDEVIIALPAVGREQILSIGGVCEQQGVRFKIVPDMYELSLTLVDLNDLRGIPLIGLRQNTIRGFNLATKRTLDVVVAAALLLLFSPVWLAIALAIKLDSPGPVLFWQKRLGKDGRPFAVYKFRSMRVGAEAEREQLRDLNESDGPLFKIRNDPRLTKVGRLLRRLSVDEVPQILNVLRGEMSLVGPRPPTPDEVEQYEPWQRRRLEVMPGMTGLWQVSGRSELPFDEMMMLDIYYIDNWSVSLDLQILLRTLPAVLSGHGAY